MSILPHLKLALIVLAVAYVSLALFAYLAGDRLAFPSPPASYSDSPDILKVPYGDEGKTISILHLQNPKATSVILYSTGNMEDLGTSLPRLEALRDLGYHIVAWDYPGYGTSEGVAREKSVEQAAFAVLRFVREELAYPFENIILYGRSIGGGPSVWLASQAPVQGLVLEGTFTGIFRVVTKVPILPWDVFPNIKRISQVQCPVLILHGTQDSVVPFSHGKKLFDAAPEQKSFVWFDGGGHNNLVEDFPEIYFPSLQNFLQSLD